jgi:hypothetical protein
MGGSQYLPIPGPVTILCDQAGLLSVMQAITPASPAATLAEEFVNYTASGGLSGAEILRSVDLLQTMLTAQMKQSKAAPRTMDFDFQARSANATEEFAQTVTRSVSNMLMDVHRPGWSELDSSRDNISLCNGLN